LLVDRPDGDGEAAWRLERKRPSAVLPAGRVDVEPVVLEALIDLVDVRSVGWMKPMWNVLG
jgi:hypothetical protein